MKRGCGAATSTASMRGSGTTRTGAVAARPRNASRNASANSRAPPEVTGSTM